MIEKIEPALSAEEWRDRQSIRAKVVTTEVDGAVMLLDEDTLRTVTVVPDGVGALIAVANAALPDSDPRKITREKLTLLRQWAEYSGPDRMPGNYGVEIWEFIVALESYLPPE